jgi:hypothetical protein
MRDADIAGQASVVRPDAGLIGHALSHAAEVMFGSRPTAIYAQHLVSSSGRMKHHSWRDHHPLSRSGGHSHHADDSSSQSLQEAEDCEDCGARAGLKRTSDGMSQSSSSPGTSHAVSPIAEAAAIGSNGSRALIAKAAPDTGSARHDGDAAAEEDGSNTGIDDIRPPMDVTWNIIPADQDGSSSDAEVGASRKASVQRHRIRVRKRPCAACEARDK